MLVGRPPFDAASAQAVIAGILTREARSVRSQRATVPAHVDAAIHTALSKLPADRFSSAAAFRGALDNPSFTRAVDGEAATNVGGLRWKLVSAVLAATTLVMAALLPREAGKPDRSLGVSKQRIVLGTA